MAPPLLTLQDIGLTFGGHPILDGAALSVHPGDRLCLVGRNGSGKSTLLKIVAGQIEADHGERFLHPSATVRYLPQEPDFTGFKTILDYVEAGLDDGAMAYRAVYLLEQLGLHGDENPAQLSGGEARRAAIARTLAPEPDILLLDEPTNHLDLPTVEWLESELKSLKSAMVLISHDRRFLENLGDAVIWLDRGQARRMDRGFAHFEAWRDEVLEQEELDKHKLDRKLVAEADWLRYGVTARRKRNQGRLRKLQGLREDRRLWRSAQGGVKLQADQAKSSGKIVIEAEGIEKSFDDRPIIRDFSTRVLRGDRLAIVGPNGAGKTTMLNILTGNLEPEKGTVKVGISVEMVTLEQSRASLKPHWTLAEALTGGSGDSVTINGQPRHVVGYMKDFLFAPNQAGTDIQKLSGGERGRLMLARALSQPSNLLVLDEPTNDLDLETLDLLQELLADYAGTVILVSHDRDFLDRVATSVIAYEGDGLWLEYAGGYNDMLAQRGQDLAARKALEKQALKSGSDSGEPGKTGGAPSSRAKGKLSYKDKYALETLPKTIAALEQTIQAQSGILADASLYSRDPDAFETASALLTKAETEKAQAEDQWLDLEMKREDMEGGD